MDCMGCKHSITPGLEIVFDELKIVKVYCPYCLETVKEEFKADTQTARSLSVKRIERRLEIRNRFADRLLSASRDGAIHCPICEHRLNKTDETLFRGGEHFKCHLCCHDLANVAYQQEAYHEQRWLPVVVALGDLYGEKKCIDCGYLGAMAKICQSAFFNMTSFHTKPTRLLAKILRRTRWRQVTNCDAELCFAVKQYRRTAGDGLLVL